MQTAMFRIWTMVTKSSSYNENHYTLSVLLRLQWSLAPSPTPRRSSYWKGSLLVALDTVANFTYLLVWKPE